MYGKEVEVETDHKPPQSIFKKSLYQAPSRLQKMLLQLQSYSLTVKYTPGKEMDLADTLSRSNLKETSEILVPDLEVNLVQMLAISPEKYSEFQEATAKDPVLSSLKRQILQGWPKCLTECPSELRAHWTFREDIAYQDGLLFKNDRIIVLQVLRC